MAEEQVKQTGEAFQAVGKGVWTTVESVKLVDFLEDYDKAVIADYEELSYWMNEDGTYAYTDTWTEPLAMEHSLIQIVEN